MTWLLKVKKKRDEQIIMLYNWDGNMASALMANGRGTPKVIALSGLPITTVFKEY